MAKQYNDLQSMQKHKGMGKYKARKGVSQSKVRGTVKALSRQLKALNRQRELDKLANVPKPDSSGRVVTVRQRDPNEPTYLFW